MNMKSIAAVLLSTTVLMSAVGCTVTLSPKQTDAPEQTPALTEKPEEEYADAVKIEFSGTVVTVDGRNVTADSEQAVYESRDIIYYEDKDVYDSGYPYGEGREDEKHSAESAEEHTVINITAPGRYLLSGNMPAGQVRVDLGEESRTDPGAKVTLVLDNFDITCTVAPAILFLNVYECDGEWTAETAGPDVDTADAGANIIIADGSHNRINGSHVARIFKDKEGEKKLWKQDGALYSYMSMNIDGGKDGSGILDVNADNEGVNSELHLTVLGGNINIFSQDDGINTNEDGVSVTTINGGELHILAGLGTEGDGIDSNGWLVINGGTVVAMANPGADAGLDSDMGSYVNGGTVVALGSTMDWAETDSKQVTNNLRFSEYRDASDAIVFTDTDGRCVFAYDPSEDEIASARIRKYMGAVISCPNFELGETYNVYIGGTVTGKENMGMYDAESITEYEGGVRQTYTGGDVRGFGGFMGRPPEGGFGMPFNGELDPGDMPETPFDMAPPKGGFGMPFNGELDPGDMPETPFDMTPPEGGFGMPFGGEHAPDGMPEIFAADTGEASTEFYMQDNVNSFSGVADEET